MHPNEILPIEMFTLSCPDAGADVDLDMAPDVITDTTVAVTVVVCSATAPVVSDATVVVFRFREDEGKSVVYTVV